MSMSSVALRAQIASVIDALCKAAVAEIAKVVEDGMVVLRLEMCQRDSEIQKLKSNVEVLHGELRSARERLTRRPGDRGRDESQSDVGDARTLLEKVQAVQDPSCASTPEVKVKCEPMEEGGKEAGGRPDHLALFDRDSAQWLPAAQTQAGRGESDFLNMGPNASLCLPETPLDAAAPCSGPAGFHPGPFGRGPLGHSQYRNLNNAARRRTVKRLMFKKGFLCPYCGKYFERSGHLERHKRIHTGEKPYRCEICGRRFNQNCSLKEHTKIHRRNIQPRPVEIQVAEQKHVPEVNPCTDPHRPEEASQMSAGDGLPKNEDILSTPVQVKSEPVEENITQPPFQGGTGQAMEGVDSLGENFAAFERDGQQWMSRLHGPNGSEISSTEYPGGSAQSAPSFPAMAQLLPPPVEASCGTFQFPGKLHGELKNSLIPQTPYGSSDPLMMSGEAGLHGLVGATLNHHHHHHPRASRSFQVIKPKKSFVCSYCAKVFERAGHLERHLRIHTGEKPYGCHICGRCFNQKSSLKGHMKTHRNGENADVLDAPHMMFTIPDNQLLKNLAEPKIGLAAPEEQVPGSTYSEPAAEQTVVVKLEPNGDDFQAVGQAGTENGTGAPDHSQLWTSGMEKSGDGGQQGVCLLLHDVKYHLSPVAGATSEQQGYTSPIKDLPFLDHKEKEEMLHTDQFTVMAMQAGGSDMTLAPELQDHHLMQEVTVSDYAALSDRPHEGGVFEFNMAAGDHEDNRGGADATRQNCFICSCCGQSFDSFGSFQRHQCADVTEPSFSCGTCGKVFNQMSILKLHQKLHVE